MSVVHVIALSHDVVVMIEPESQDVRQAGIPAIKTEVVHSFDWGCEDTCSTESFPLSVNSVGNDLHSGVVEF